MSTGKRTLRKSAAAVASGLALILVSGCGAAATTTAAAPPTGTTTASAAGTATTAATAPATSVSTQVLPVPQNPISNTSTAPGLTITKVLVENNISPDTGKGVGDHLEIQLKNSTAKPLDQVGIYFKITDPMTAATEGYYTELAGFSIPAGGTRIVHFDQTTATDHFPVNKYSLFYTDKNALSVDVMASSPNVQPATFTVQKAAGGAEAGVE